MKQRRSRDGKNSRNEIVFIPKVLDLKSGLREQEKSKLGHMMH
jgi:hypothetical protein